MNIGFIGLGIMGKPMALNLIEAGYFVYINDVNKKSMEEVEKKGGVVCTDIKNITDNCEIIITMLPHGKIVEQVLFSENSLYDNATNGTLIVDMSSISPVEAKSFAVKLKEKNIHYIDAPVSGGEPKAIDGTLSIMVGAQEKDFKKAIELFNIMGTNIVRGGEVGKGSALKLANQILVSIHLAAVSEASIFASKSGIDIDKMYEAVNAGLAGSAVLDAKIPMIRSRNFEPGGKMATNFKDLRNIINAADDLDLPLPVTNLVEELFRSEIANGNENKDHSYILNYYERNSNHTI